MSRDRTDKLKFEASKLFGRFNHKVVLPETNGISIITAPNGYGKSAILRIINSIFNSNFSYLTKIEFEKIRITLGAGKYLTISKTKREKTNASLGLGIEFQTSGTGFEAKKFTYSRNLSASDLRVIERHLPIEKVDNEYWLDYQTDDLLNLDQVLDRYKARLPNRFGTANEIPDWLSSIQNSVNVHFVETQRLLHIDERVDRRAHGRRQATTTAVVEKNATDLARKIGRLLQSYANKSQIMDQTFPKRILDIQREKVSSEGKIRKDLQELAKKRDELISVGMLDSTMSAPISPSPILKQENIRRILDVYVEDTFEKLNIFDETYGKVNLFKNLLDEHLQFKNIEIDSLRGIRAIDEENGKTIPLDALSSGEQHELVLIYGLLFQVEENAVILIDEPELSLHVSWQKKFIDDIQRIQKLKNLRVVIATHSPQIIHDKWNLVQELSA